MQGVYGVVGRGVLWLVLWLLAGCGKGGGTGPGPNVFGGDPVAPLGACGDPIDPGVAADGFLALDGSFPADVRAGDQGLADGTVTLSNRGRAPFAAVAATAADVYVTREGRIVALPMDRDDSGLLLELPAGGSHQLPAPARLHHCGGESAGAPLPAGAYQVYAVVAMTADDGRSFTVVGGPWPVRVV